MYNHHAPELNDCRLQDINRSRQSQRLAQESQPVRTSPVSRVSTLVVAISSALMMFFGVL